MNQICELKDGIFFIRGKTNVGVITENLENSKKGIYLVDSGSSSDDGKFILEVLDDYFGKNSYILKAIINTHSHADHTGGNKFIQEKTNCEIWFSEKERGSSENPHLQGSVIWGGFPPKEFQTFYYKAEVSKADKIYYEGEKIFLSDKKSIEFIDLKGHYYQNSAIVALTKNEEKVVFAGDAIFARSEISKFWIPFLIQPKEFCNSLDKLCSVKKMIACVPGHGELILDNILETAELNKIAVFSTKQCILDVIKKSPQKKVSTEEIIRQTAQKNELKLKFSSYVLIGSTIRSYLSELHDEGKIEVEISENVLYWK